MTMVAKGSYDFDFEGRKILLVEDNHVAFKVTSSMLHRAGLELDHAWTGEEAVELCRNQFYDLVLMDMQLPGIDGMEATRRIRAIRPDQKVIAATASDYMEDREAFLKAGCEASFIKPLKFRDLFEFMQQLFRQGNG